MSERLDANDSYWWILTGGIHVPGFGAYAGEPDETSSEIRRSSSAP
ncbi:hypothetical protein [Arthrobacter sp. ISL-72]|nr:hypothetical protein [Arthrobacter sp. ISL-72]MBT2597944.1 hypothetical protein [Arthrobacter sp. ISL-72]